MIDTVYILGYSTPDHFQPLDATLNFDEAEKWIVLPSEGGENTMNCYRRVEFEP